MGKSGMEKFQERTGEVWTIHLHNQWNKRFPVGGWMDRLFERYTARLEEISKGMKRVDKPARIQIDEDK